MSTAAASGSGEPAARRANAAHDGPHKPDAPVRKKVATPDLPGSVGDVTCEVTDDDPMDAVCHPVEPSPE